MSEVAINNNIRELFVIFDNRHTSATFPDITMQKMMVYTDDKIICWRGTSISKKRYLNTGESRYGYYFYTRKTAADLKYNNLRSEFTNSGKLILSSLYGEANS